MLLTQTAQAMATSTPSYFLPSTCSLMGSLKARQQGRKMSNSPPPRLYELICLKKWQTARENVEADAESVYETSGHNQRLGIHELCQLVACPISLETNGDISDDEDEEHADDEEKSRACFDCVNEDNRRICELAKLMIEKSHSLGPVKVVPPHENLGNETLLNTDEEGETQLQVHESILTVTDTFGKTPLHVLCENSVDTQMMRVILDSTREHTQNPCAPTAVSLISAKDSRGCTPLHYLAYSRQCPFPSLELMMDYCKVSSEESSDVSDPTLCTDTDGDTPLHWALDMYMSPRRIKQLIRHSKRALPVKNQAGKRPFDQFVGNFVDTDWQLHELCGREVWDNIQAYLKVVAEAEVSSEKEWLPVHMLAGSSIDFPSVFMDIALHYNKEDLSKPNGKGLLPLHLACARQSMDPETPSDGTWASKILALYPQAAYKATNSKRLAIHVAVESQKPLLLIASLLKAYPNSLNVKDPRTGLWPFILAGVDNHDDCNTSYALLRADPSIIQIAIKALISKRGHRAAQALRHMDPSELEEHSSRRLRRFELDDSTHS